MSLKSVEGHYIIGFLCHYSYIVTLGIQFFSFFQYIWSIDVCVFQRELVNQADHNDRGFWKSLFKEFSLDDIEID
jgi:hypothetical protein